MTPAKATKRARGGGDAARVLRARLGLGLKVALALGAVWFAVEGGEYGTSDLLRQRRAAGQLRAEIDSLQLIVDSLGRYRRRILTDPVLQEQIAREEFGMVKGPNELLYRFAEPGTGVAAGDARAPAGTAAGCGRTRRREGGIWSAKG